MTNSREILLFTQLHMCRPIDHPSKNMKSHELKSLKNMWLLEHVIERANVLLLKSE